MAARPPGGAPSRAVGRPRGFRKKGIEACRGVFTYLCPLWQDKLFEHYPLWTFSQAEAGRMLTRTPLLWWMGGYEEASFTPHERPSQFLLASNFYNSRDVTVGWFDSKIVIFLLQKCLGQNQLLTESLPQNGTGSPWGGGGGRMFPPPCPGLSHLSVCAWAAHFSRSHLAKAACCCFHTKARAAPSRARQEVWLFLLFL